MEKRSKYIDVAKGVAILLVVYGHAAAQMKGTLFFEEYLQGQNKIIFSFAMPLFFMISGAFQRTRLDMFDFNHKAYLTKISLSSLLPFYSLSLIFLLMNLLLSNYIDAPSLKEMMFAMLMQQSNSDFLPSGVLWFLFTLFSFSIITYLSFKVLSVNHVLLFAFAIFLRSDLNIWRHAYYFSFDKISQNFIFYITGYYLYKIIIAKPFSRISYMSFFLLCYILLSIVSSVENSNFTIFEYVNKIDILFGVSGICGSLFILGFSFNASSKLSDNVFVEILSYYGAYSILIYVFHMPTFAVFKKIAEFASVEASFFKQFILFFPGVILPLAYGKILSCHRSAYKVILGRMP